MEVRGSISMSFVCPICDKKFKEMHEVQAHYNRKCRVNFDFWDLDKEIGK